MLRVYFNFFINRYALDEHRQGRARIDATKEALAQHDACQSVAHVGVQHVKSSRETRAYYYYY